MGNRARTRHSKAEVADIAERARALHDADGLTWKQVNEALGLPYSSGTSLTSALRHYEEHGDDPDGAEMAEEEDRVSREWANAPPEGSERWTDYRWLQAIRVEAKRRLKERTTDDG